jgi:hypothetical protein
MTVKLKGAEELAALLEQLPEKAALKASRTGLAKSAARLRTYIRRAAPRKDGKLRLAIRSAVARKSPQAFVKLGKIRGESKIRFYYKTLEFGRKPHKRKGKPRAGSPQMATHFFNYAFARHRTEIAQMTVEETRKAIFKETARLAVRMNAPLRVRGGGR